jgi:Flp pilus assembly protein TadG
MMIGVLLGIADFAGVFNTSIALSNAARAGAQYGSRSVATAANTTGMVNAAKQDAPNLSAISVSASQCTCATGSSVTACAASYCTNNPSRTFVTVNTSLTYNTIVAYPGLPTSYAMTGKAVMEVGQ